jgi:hypothetical protein
MYIYIAEQISMDTRPYMCFSKPTIENPTTLPQRPNRPLPTPPPLRSFHLYRHHLRDRTPRITHLWHLSPCFQLYIIVSLVELPPSCVTVLWRWGLL